MGTTRGRGPSDQQIRREIQALIATRRKALRSRKRFSVWKLLGVVWDGYCADQLARSEITTMARSTSYLFGILRWWQAKPRRDAREIAEGLDRRRACKCLSRQRFSRTTRASARILC
jgi:hypothetical protein